MRRSDSSNSTNGWRTPRGRSPTNSVALVLNENAEVIYTGLSSAQHACYDLATSTMASGLLTMATEKAIAQYKAFAEECDRLVQEVEDPRDKQELNEMAQAGRKLAEEQDGKNQD